MEPEWGYWKEPRWGHKADQGEFMMASISKRIGEAGSTSNIGNYGLIIFNYYQKNNYEPLL